MAEFRTIAMADILIPERLREVDEDQALILSTQIGQQGLLNPITVRKTPPRTKPFAKYTLIAGAHRLRAVRMLRRTEIDAMVVEADALDAVIMEISENLIRNELTALDRAVFVLKYREAWEEKHGKIDQGFRRSSVNLTELSEANVLDVVEAMEGSTFFEHAAQRLGIHPESIKRAQRIGQKLSPDLRRQLRGTPTADNQSELLKLARLTPERQASVARAISAGHDTKAALEHTDPHAKAKADRSAQDEIRDRLISTWERANEKTKASFLEHIGATIRVPREKLPSVTEILAQTDVGGGGGIMSPEPVDPRQITIFEVLGGQA